MQEIKAPDGTLIKVATINSLLKRVGDAWEEKFVPLYLESEQFYPEFKDWDNIHIGLSSYALVEAVGNAHEDIKRWCYFHLAGKSQEYVATPDRHKYGGFLAKWIAKEKPIFVEQKSSKTPVDIPDSLYRLNAFFAVTVLQDYLLQPIPPRLAEELAYILHFRDESGEVLALLGYCAEEMAMANIRS